MYMCKYEDARQNLIFSFINIAVVMWISDWVLITARWTNELSTIINTSTNSPDRRHRLAEKFCD